MKIAIVGAGLIGCERILAIQKISELLPGSVELSAVYDPSDEISRTVSNKFNAPVCDSLELALQTKPDWVFIATPNHVVKNIAQKAFNAGANVLVEKPCGRSLEECDEIISLRPNNLKLNVGFNYRFFAGVESAFKDAKEGKFGKLISVNLILGHGNSPGMEKSWKLDPVMCGNCVTDLGVHAFDITLQLASGMVNIEHKNVWSGFWNTGVVEEAHWIAKDEQGTIFNTQVSYNRWKSTFKIEINGTEGYGIVENRGRSYGPQSYKTGKRWGWLSGKKQTDTEEYHIDNYDCADSFTKETISILNLSKDITAYNNLPKACSHIEARKIMALLSDFESRK